MAPTASRMITVTSEPSSRLERLHRQAAPTVELTVLRITVGVLPRRATPSAPLWPVRFGATLPADLTQLWRWHEQRFAIEHLFHFLKQTSAWTAVGARAAERWTQLAAAKNWELWLAWPELSAVRSPWEHPLDPARATPGQVRRGFSGLLARVGKPARPPQTWRKSPGRQHGKHPGRRLRYGIHRRSPPPVAKPTLRRANSARAMTAAAIAPFSLCPNSKN